MGALDITQITVTTHKNATQQKKRDQSSRTSALNFMYMPSRHCLLSTPKYLRKDELDGIFTQLFTTSAKIYQLVKILMYDKRSILDPTIKHWQQPRSNAWMRNRIKIHSGSGPIFLVIYFRRFKRHVMGQWVACSVSLHNLWCHAWQQYSRYA